MAGPGGGSHGGGFGGGFGDGSVVNPGGPGGSGIINFEFFFDIIERFYNSVDGLFTAFNKPISELIGTVSDGVGLIDFLLENLLIPLFRWLPILDRTPLELLFFSIPLVIVFTVIKSVL